MYKITLYFIECYNNNNNIYTGNDQMASHWFRGRAASRYAGTSLSHAHWLSHISTEHLMRQVQQQRWQLPGRRTSMLTLAPVTFLSQLRLRPWASSTHQLATSGGQGPPSNTMCHWTPQVCLPNGICKSVERFKQGAWMWQTTDRRQTMLRRNG